MTMAKKIVAIDIGSANVKAALLTRPRGSVRVLRFACRPRDEVEHPRDLLDDLGVSRSTIASALIDEHVALRHLFLPSLTPKEIAQVIDYEVEPHLPWPIGDVAVTCIPCAEGPDGWGVLAAAVLRSALDDHLSAFGRTRVSRVSFSVSSLLSLARIAEPGDGAPWVLADIGASKTNLLLVENGMLHAARSLRAGIGGTAPDPDVESGSLSEYATEAARAVEWLVAGVCLRQPPDRLLLTGGGALASGLPEALEDKLGLAVTRMQCDDLFDDAMAGDSKALACTLGAGAIGAGAEVLLGEGVDFRQAALPPRNVLQRFRAPLVAAALILGLALWGWGAVTLRRSRDLRAERVQCKQRQEQAWRRAYPTGPLPSDLKLALAAEVRKLKLGQEQTVPPRHGSALDILLEIAKLLPPGTKFEDTDFRITQKTVTVQAETASMDSAELIEKALGQSPHFEAMSRDLKPLGPNRIRINLEVRIVEPMRDEG